jgi:hypothetical protein
MSVKEIEIAVSKLPEDEVWEFAKWFEEFQAALWDKEIEEDIKAGRLDEILAEVRGEIEAGRVEPL